MFVDDLEPQLAANRRFWTGWDSGQSDLDLPIYRTDVRHSLMNGVMRVQNVPLDTAIAEARSRLDGCVWSWWVGADSDEHTAEGLLERGAQQIGDMPIMAINLESVVHHDAPADGLRIDRVLERPAVEAFVRAYADPLGYPESAVDKQVEQELKYSAANPATARLAGVIDGRIVGTAVVSLESDIAAVYFIATDPAFRRRGIATALTIETLRVAREAGHRIATLQASSLGEPVYRRIGFQTVGRYRLFTFPASKEPQA